ERFMNYLEEQTDGEAMINSIKNGDQLIPRVTQVSIAGTTLTENPPLKDKSMCNKTAKDLWDALARHMLSSEYGEQDRKATVLSVAIQKIIQNQGDVNDAMGSKKKIVVITSDPLALIAEKTNVSRNKEKVVVSLDSEGSEVDDFSEMKKITTVLKDKYEQVLLAEDQAWMESSSDSDQEINANMVFMAQFEKVLFDFEASSSFADEKISE
nr:hypothetical protein [Tanacetum cinerariifolium]